MLITLEQMDRIHKVQIEMFRELKRVLDELNIRYYFVHGSLLSAVTTHKFIDEDDDIDIAIFRSDYERLLEKGNKIISEPYFIQSSKNDDFPLSFAKLRDKKTMFYQPVLEKCICNKGIYIDIFPIDYVPRKERLWYKTKCLLLKSRTSEKLNVKRGRKTKGLLLLSKMVFPSYKKTMQKREDFFASFAKSEYVTIFGGKSSEYRMKASWFGEGVAYEFCGMMVNCPSNFDAYLTRIYGENYHKKNPAEDRISDDKRVEISASYVDFGDGIIIKG